MSFSPAITTITDKTVLDEVIDDCGDNLKLEKIILENTSFAIRCLSVGKHSFTSQELGSWLDELLYEILMLQLTYQILI